MAVYYRAVNHWPAVRDDFLSDGAKGMLPRPEQINDARLYAGISVFDSLEHTSVRRARYPRFLPLTVVMEIPPDAPVRAEKTLWRGHYSLIADPEALMTYVVGLIE